MGCIGSTHDEPLDEERGGARLWAISDMAIKWERLDEMRRAKESAIKSYRFLSMIDNHMRREQKMRQLSSAVTWCAWMRWLAVAIVDLFAGDN